MIKIYNSNSEIQVTVNSVSFHYQEVSKPGGYNYQLLIPISCFNQISKEDDIENIINNKGIEFYTFWSKIFHKYKSYDVIAEECKWVINNIKSINTEGEIAKIEGECSKYDPDFFNSNGDNIFRACIRKIWNYFKYRRNRSVTDHLFYLSSYLYKKVIEKDKVDEEILSIEKKLDLELRKNDTKWIHFLKESIQEIKLLIDSGDIKNAINWISLIMAIPIEGTELDDTWFSKSIFKYYTKNFDDNNNSRLYKLLNKIFGETNSKINVFLSNLK